MLVKVAFEMQATVSQKLQKIEEKLKLLKENF